MYHNYVILAFYTLSWKFCCRWYNKKNIANMTQKSILNHIREKMNVKCLKWAICVLICGVVELLVVFVFIIINYINNYINNLGQVTACPRFTYGGVFFTPHCWQCWGETKRTGLYHLLLKVEKLIHSFYRWFVYSNIQDD